VWEQARVEKRAVERGESLKSRIYIFFIFYNIYITMTPTCFDTFVSSSGCSTIVLR
jgi:hypothetical protein